MVFAVRGCIGNRGLGVEVGFPDVKAGSRKGNG